MCICAYTENTDLVVSLFTCPKSNRYGSENGVKSEEVAVSHREEAGNLLLAREPTRTGDKKRLSDRM